MNSLSPLRITCNLLEIIYKILGINSTATIYATTCEKELHEHEVHVTFTKRDIFILKQMIKPVGIKTYTHALLC